MNQLISNFISGFISSMIFFSFTSASYAAHCVWEKENLEKHWNKHKMEMMEIFNNMSAYEEYSLRLCNSNLNEETRSPEVIVCDYDFTVETLKQVFYGIDVPSEIVTTQREHITGIYDSTNKLFIPAVSDNGTIYKIKSMYKLRESSFRKFCNEGYKKVVEIKGQAVHID